MKEIEVKARVVDLSTDLDLIRQKIDKVDAEILQLLSQRMKLVADIGHYKSQHQIPPLDKNRWKQVLETRLLLARELDLDTDMVADIYERIHSGALKLEALIKE